MRQADGRAAVVPGRLIVPLSLTSLARTVHVAEDLLRSGDIDGARSLYASALAGRLAAVGGQTGRLTEQDGRVVEQLAALTSSFGDEGAVLGLLEMALASALARNDDMAADRIRLRLIHVHVGRGDITAARETLSALETRIGPVEAMEFTEHGLRRFERNLPWSLPDKDRLLPELYLQLGRLLTAMAMPTAAVALLLRGRTFGNNVGGPARGAESPVALDLALAAASIAAGRLADAEAVLARLPTLTASLVQPWEVPRLELQGQCAFMRGNLAGAVEALQGAVAAATVAGLSKARIRAIVNLLAVRVALNQALDVERLLPDIAESAAEDPRARRQLRRLQAWIGASSSVVDPDLLPVVVFQGASEEVADVTAEEQPEARGEPYRFVSPDPLARMGAAALEIRRRLGTPSEAARLLRRVEDEWCTTDSPLISVRLRHLKALVEYFSAAASGDGEHLDEAERQLAEVCAELERLGLRYDLYEARRFLIRVRQRKRADSQALASLTGDTQALLDSMTNGLDATTRAQFLLNKWRQDEESLALEINRLQAALESTRWAPLRWVRRLRGVQALIARVYANRMELLDQAPKQVRTSEADGVMSVLRSLFLHSRDQLTIAALVLPSAVVLITRGWMRQEVLVSEVSRTELRGLVRRWHEAVTALTREDPNAIAEEIARRIGLDAALRTWGHPRIRRLVFVPDDALHGFPFAALRIDGSYLIRRFAVSVAHHPQERSRPRLRRGRVVAFAVDREMARWAALPATTDQLRDFTNAMAPWNAVPEVHLNPIVGDERVLKILEGAWVVHVSGHGTFEPDSPDRTGLVVPDEHGGARVLSLRSLARARLDETEHITLASCWAADNYVRPGRWIVSLPQLLRGAGARSVLACLWEVDDRRSTEFLRSFYMALGSLRRDDALRSVQLRCLEEGRNSDPIWWAGFQLYGEGGRIRP